MESKQHAPSVLGKLMGLDELPTQQNAKKHKRVLSENYLRRVASIGILDKRSPLGYRSFKMSVEEHKELKDIFQVEGIYECDEQYSNMSAGNEKADFGLSPASLTFTRQSRRNEKEVYFDNMIQTSKEFADSPEVIDSRNILPRHIRKQNSAFTKQDLDQRGAGSFSKVNHKKLLKSSCTLENGYVSVDRKSGRIIERGNVKLHHKMENGLSQSHEDPSHRKNIDNLKNAVRLSSMTSSHKDSYSGNKKQKQLPSSKDEKPNFGEKDGNSNDELSTFRQTSRVVGEILEGIRRKTRYGSVSFPDKSSELGSTQGGTFGEESKLSRPSSPSSCYGKSPSSLSSRGESYVARDARKQMVDQWKKSGKSDEVGRACQGSNEILAVSHSETWLRNLNDKPLNQIPSNQTQTDGHAYSERSLCISSKDQRKNKLVGNVPRFRNFSSTTVIARPRSQTRHEARRRWFPRQEGSDSQAHHGVGNQSSDLLESSQPRHLRSSHGKFQFCPCYYSEHNQTSKDTCKVIGDLKSKGTKMDLDIAKTEVVHGSSKEQQDEPRVCMLSEKDDDLSSLATNASIQQETSNVIHEEDSAFSNCSGTEPDSLVSLEEAYQCSPISVLEPLCREETSSSSESLKKPGINISDLQLQLELMMSESSERNVEEPGMILSSDEDSEDGSVGEFKGNEDIMSVLKGEDSRNFSYVVDVLTEACFNGRNLDTSFCNWHSPEYPISLSVLETLEKKFGEQMSWKRTERRLLFDLINMGLTEILQSFSGVPEWAKPVARRFRPRPIHETIEDEVWISLDSLQKEGGKDLVEKSLGKEIGWLDLGDEIDGICKELERSFVDELAAEFVSSEIF